MNPWRVRERLKSLSRLLLEENKKKRLISLLLLASCMVCSLLLALTPHSSVSFLRNLEQADSLIVHNLKKFSIPDQQIRVEPVYVDSSLTRKVYTVNVSQGLSKTQLHLELSKAFHSYNISTPAKITFPEEDMTIHMVYNQTVVRTVKLQTDTDLVLKPSFGSILIAFDSTPSESLLEKVIDFGEPIPLVLTTADPIKTVGEAKRLRENYPYLLFWLKDDKGNNIPGNGSSQTHTKLRRLEQAMPGATVLSFPQLISAASSGPIQPLSKTSLHYVDVSEAILLDPGTGRPAFKQELTKFVRQANRNEFPIAIVIGNNTSLAWLKAELFSFKKAGLEIVLPPKKQF